LVTNTMSEETTKGNGARTLSPGSSGNQSANNVLSSDQKTVLIISPFVRCGFIQMENEALRIDYQSFGTDHTVFIGTVDLQHLVRDRFAPPAPVMQIRHGIDGAAEIVEKIGYAARTVSGKAIKIQTTMSGGDMIVPWTGFVHVVNKKIKSMAISRIRVPEAPRPAAPAPGRNIQKGLTRGF